MQDTSLSEMHVQASPTHDYAGLKPGDKLRGFTVERCEDVHEIDGRAIKMRHDASGARLLFLHNADANKSFSISFKTPPADDTGVFHILEHSVLNGSRKFPVKEPFVNLIKNSMQTFLNAMTFADKTMFPVASTNSQDLLNLMDVYMDAVLHPAIYERPHIFEQEGWHTELVASATGQGTTEQDATHGATEQDATDKDATYAAEQGGIGAAGQNATANGCATAPEAAEANRPALTYNGVVYNEMKGALSDPDSVLYDAVNAALFPDNAYRFESGGDPRFIPNLTYEQFIDTHSRHYRLDNSYIVLYGDLELERFLGFLDENYLAPDASAHRDAAAPNPLVAQAPVRTETKTVKMRTTPDNACMALGYVVGDIHDRLRVHATDILLEALCGCNEAPLKRALLEADLGGEVFTHFQDGVLQPSVFLEVHGVKGDARERFQSVVETEVRRLVDGGLDHEIIASAMAHEEFDLRECNFGFADGVAWAIAAMDGWLYDDDLDLAYVHYEDMFAEMRRLLEGDYFERLLESVFLTNDHMACVFLEPTDEEQTGPADERLAAREASLTEQQAAEIAEATERLREEQQRADTPENLAKLPHLNASDIEAAPEELPPTVEDTPFGPVLRHHIATRGIAYANRYYDLSGLSVDDLPYASLVAMMLTCLDTTSHTAAELVPLLQSNLGTLEFKFSLTESPDDPMRVWPKLNASVAALGPNAGVMARLANEIMLTTRFDDTARIRNMVEQKKIGLEQEFAMQGNKAAARHAAASMNASAALREWIDGVRFYQFLCEMLDDFDERSDALSSRLASVARAIFTNTDCLISFTGSDDELDAYLRGHDESARTFADALATVEPAPLPGLEVALADGEPEAFEVPADVTFAAIALDVRTPEFAEIRYNGSWPLACRALTYDYLWNEVRVKGGAYGVAFVLPFTGAARFASFRDPHLDQTITRFEEAGAWLSTFAPTDEEWEGFVVSTVAGLDAPQKPRALIKRQAGYHIAAIDPSVRAKTRAQVIACTQDDIRAVGELVSKIAQTGTRCVFGNAGTIEASALDWKVTKLV